MWDFRILVGLLKNTLVGFWGFWVPNPSLFHCAGVLFQYLCYWLSRTSLFWFVLGGEFSFTCRALWESVFGLVLECLKEQHFNQWPLNDNVFALKKANVEIFFTNVQWISRITKKIGFKSMLLFNKVSSTTIYQKYNQKSSPNSKMTLALP